MTTAINRLCLAASSMRRLDDARPAASGDMACGKTTAARNGKMGRMSGTGRSIGS